MRWDCRGNLWLCVCLISGYIPATIPWELPLEEPPDFCYCCEFLRLSFSIYFTYLNWFVTLNISMVFAALFPVHFTAVFAAMARDLLWRANYEKWPAVQVLFTDEQYIYYSLSFLSSLFVCGIYDLFIWWLLLAVLAVGSQVKPRAKCSETQRRILMRMRMLWWRRLEWRRPSPVSAVKRLELVS